MSFICAPSFDSALAVPGRGNIETSIWASLSTAPWQYQPSATSGAPQPQYSRALAVAHAPSVPRRAHLVLILAGRASSTFYINEGIRNTYLTCGPYAHRQQSSH
ncbi:hypothetical protein C8R44DRAFT_890385 [Mycena epipterygia]|nr:hypothetical protein C8R44DRAFT_890385 [Mycena epipterygia]